MRFSMRTHSGTRFTLAMRTFSVLSNKPPRDRVRSASGRTCTCLEISWYVRSAFPPDDVLISSQVGERHRLVRFAGVRSARRRIDIRAHRRHAVPVVVGPDHDIGLIARRLADAFPSR
jgi:hypothetical protein